MNNSHVLKITILSIVTSLVIACGSAPKYACKASLGLGCISVRGVYDKVTRGELNIKQPSKIKSPISKPSPEGYKPVHAMMVNVSSPTYVAPKVMRIWIGPWADKNGVYHSQSYVYKVVSKGRWLNQPGKGAPIEVPAVYTSSIHSKKH
ncbi:hypothetical protein MNBD_GAMMA12-3102 [hydrothermal vent metagenome]|uniref:Type IV conjugative transfer system protein TraV n=1 Tax=hydrothermal vent metagenome TaxID=652676 RepID=A0A3B0Z9N7_9ZZZZ